MATSAPSRSGGSHAKSVAEREATLDVTSCGRSQPLAAGNPLLGSPLSESKCGHLVKRKRNDLRCAPLAIDRCTRCEHQPSQTSVVYGRNIRATGQCIRIPPPTIFSPSSDPLVLPFVQTAPQILHDRGLEVPPPFTLARAFRLARCLQRRAGSGASLQRSVSLLAPALGRMLGPLHHPRDPPSAARIRDTPLNAGFGRWHVTACVGEYPTCLRD